MEFDDLRKEKIEEIKMKDPKAFLPKNTKRRNYFKRNNKPEELI